ncbi:MAG: acetaldehyde dehydrogenase (acetylating) [Myxococcota bacterium]|nr:acetaldehyde dehydrogenase (acetylating) [Myxococcales bacterium]
MSDAARKSAAIVGSGHIGTDLMCKLLRSDRIAPRWMVGIDAGSAGLAEARRLGLETIDDGVETLLASAERPDLILEATSAAVHVRNAPRYRALGIPAVDLTPAAIGPYVVPPINLESLSGEQNVNLVTCGGQATTPIVHAVSRVARVDYAEIVASIASASAGPGTRANIDEFTHTTAKALEVLGGARCGKAIIVLNPAEPPMIMRNTVFCSLARDADRDAVAASIHAMVEQVQEYVAGYRLLDEPQFTDDRVEVLLEIEGAGDFLPRYAGNLDIITSAAVRVAERMVAGRG